MDFTPRGINQTPQPNRQNNSSEEVTVHTSSSSSKGGKFLNAKNDSGKFDRWLRVGAFAFLLALVIIVSALTVLVYRGKTTEAKYINKDQYQAVFLNNGQVVYFGHLKTVNNDFLDLRDIYYLQTGGDTAAQGTANTSTVSLIKLGTGCELHRPLDQMIFNREQVTFWENISKDSTVVNAIEQLNKDREKKPEVCKIDISLSQENANTTPAQTEEEQPAAQNQTPANNRR
jgi:hypothetical protein